MKGQVYIINDTIKVESKIYNKVTVGELDVPGVIHKGVIAGNNSHNLLGAIHKSFCDHVVPIISPDIILITILQSLSLIIHDDPSSFGDVSKKVELEVRNDNLTMNPDSTTEWSNVFESFQGLIGTAFNQDLVELSTCDFTTSTPTTKVMARLALMDMVEPFAQYTASSFCGIPAIHLMGTVADWQKLANKVHSISTIYPNVSRWTQKLEPLIMKFVELSTGTVDQTYWKSLYKWSEQSGGSTVTGHINALYPMLYSQRRKGFYKNKYFDDSYTGHGTFFADFPTMNMSIPLKWKTEVGTTQLYIRGMMQHIVQHSDTGELEPVGAWWIEP